MTTTMLQSRLSGAQRTPPQNDLSEVVLTTRNLIRAARRNDGDDFRQDAERLCTSVGAWHRSRLLNPMPIDGGLAVSTIVKHNPSKHPQTKEPREFDTLFFAALFLMELAGMTATFQWLWNGKSRYYLRGEFSSAARSRFYVARIILSAEPRSCAQFNEDHHSYRLRDLIQRHAGGTMLPDGKLGRQAAIERCTEGYETARQAHHESLSPDGYHKLLTDVLTTATIFHGKRGDTPP